MAILKLEITYIGANTVVLEDVPNNITIAGVSAKIVKQRGRKI